MSQPVQRGIRTFAMIQKEELQQSMAQSSQSQASSQAQRGVMGQQGPQGFGQLQPQPGAFQRRPAEVAVGGQMVNSLDGVVTPDPKGYMTKQVPFSAINGQTRVEPMMTVSRYAPQNFQSQSGGQAFGPAHPVNQSLPAAHLPSAKSVNPNQSLNDYFAEFQRRNQSGQRPPQANFSGVPSHLTVNHSQLGANPLRVNMGQRLQESSIMSEQRSFNQLVPNADFSGSGKTVPKMTFQPEVRTQMRFDSRELVNSSFLQDRALVQTLSPNGLKVSNDFTELSAKTYRTNEPKQENNTSNVARVQAPFGNLDLKETSVLKQNKYDLIVSQDKFLNSSFKRDLDVSKDQGVYAVGEARVGAAPNRTPTTNSKTGRETKEFRAGAARELIPENPYKRLHQSILGDLDRESFQNKSLEISQNYGFIAPRVGESAFAKRPQDRQSQKKEAEMREVKRVKATKIDATPQQVLPTSLIAENQRKALAAQPIAGVDPPLEVRTDSIGEILRSIVMLVLKILEIVFNASSEVIDRVIKDEQQPTRRNSNLVALKLPLNIKFTMEPSSYDTLKKVMTVVGVIVIYRYLFK